MADNEDYAPAISPEDEQDELRRQGMYPPVGPPLAAGTFRSSTPPVSSNPLETPSLTTAPLASTPGVPQIASPEPHPATRQATPAEERMKTLVDQGAPAVHQLHGFKKGLDVLGQIFAPGVENQIRYAPQHQYQRNLDAATTGLAADKTLQDTPAAEAVAQMAPDKERATIAQEQAKATQEQALARRANQPQVGTTPEELTMHDLMTGENGKPRTNPETNLPYTYPEAYKMIQQSKAEAKPDKAPNDFEQFYKDYITDNHLPDSAHNRLLARAEYAKAGQAPQHDPRQMIIDPSGKVTEIHPGMTIAPGSKTVTGDLTNKPNADEEKRADMAENLNENLDALEEIAKRRPELFGPLAGRATQLRGWAGSNDPDIARLDAIKDRIGMVLQSTHSMRSAQHVEASANSVLNGFKNGSGAVLAAIEDTRKSAKTFTADADRAKNGANTPASAASRSKSQAQPQATHRYNPQTGQIEAIQPQ